MPRESVLDLTNTSGDNSLINWDPSHEDEFVSKTHDQPELSPELGSFYPNSLWGGEMNEVDNIQSNLKKIGLISFNLVLTNTTD